MARRVIPNDDIAAVLLTRGDVPMDEIRESLPYTEVVVWNNRERPFDAKVFGRYLAILETTKPVIFFQDDDCLVTNHDELRAEHEPGVIVANMVAGHREGEPPMLGWGALFDRDLPWRAFERWLQTHPFDWRMTKYPETVFTALTPWKRLTATHVDLPWATAETRSYKQPGHFTEFAQVLQQAQKIDSGLEEYHAQLARDEEALRRLRSLSSSPR